ncbi:MAG: ABC transporter ATP-binding protein [Methanosarcinales archaeon]|nr:ABC transporter ATP-binding protein [Methanosarcinales archaeon]
MSDMITLAGVTRSYNLGDQSITILNETYLNIESGEFICIMGPSGSGKTTLLNIMGLLDTPSTGTVSIKGEEVAKMSKKAIINLKRRTIGHVFQQFHLIPTLTAAENVALPMIFANDNMDGRVEEALELVGLSHRLKHKPGELSGGEQQRVAIARALVMKPDIILADEPTGALDQKTGANILSLLESVSEKVTLVMVTHSKALTAGSDRIINIEDGKIIGET